MPTLPPAYPAAISPDEIDPAVIARVETDRIIYLKGSESVDGSVRVRYTPSPDPLVMYEVRTAGVWVAATSFGSLGLKASETAGVHSVTSDAGEPNALSSPHSYVSANVDGTQTLSGAGPTPAHTILWQTEESDLANRLASGLYTATYTGFVEVRCDITLSGTTIATSPDTVALSIQKNSTDVGDPQDLVVASGSSATGHLCKIVPVVSGDVIRVRVSNINADSTSMPVSRANLSVFEWSQT